MHLKGIIRIQDLLVMTMVALFVVGCGAKKGLELKPLRNRSSNNILKKYNDHRFQFESLSMRIAVDVKNEDEKQSFKANVRMQQDEVIWVSITPLMGLEMVRVMITPDSLKYVSKVPNNKHFFKGTFSQLSSLTGSELSFAMVQDILIGNAVSLDERNDKFNSRIDGRSHLLVSKYNRKLKRVVGSDERELNPEDSLEVDTNDRRYQRILRRADEEDLLVKRYWINGDHFRPTRSIFDDLYYQRFVEIEHYSYKESEGQRYPHRTKVTASSPEGALTLDLEVLRLKRYASLEFPFEIPDNYERKYLP